MVKDLDCLFFIDSIDRADIFLETISSAICDALGRPTKGLAWPAVSSPSCSIEIISLGKFKRRKVLLT